MNELIGDDARIACYPNQDQESVFLTVEEGRLDDDDSEGVYESFASVDLDIRALDMLIRMLQGIRANLT